MRTDFTPDNIELWIDNWKRKEHIGNQAKMWLDSFPFEKVNVIVNHSCVTLEDFPEEIRAKIKIWRNELRPDVAVGPMNRNYNAAYVNTFLAGKKYCICAHDGMVIKPGWATKVMETDFLFYSAPQGDQVTLQTLEGLRTFGWWDERYATNGNHELDYLARVFRKCFLEIGPRASVVDLHRGWTMQGPWNRGANELHYNSIGLEDFWVRLPRELVPPCGPKKTEFENPGMEWNNRKWNNLPPTFQENIIDGPREEEINWYPWLDLNSLQYDVTGIH